MLHTYRMTSRRGSAEDIQQWSGREKRPGGEPELAGGAGEHRIEAREEWAAAGRSEELGGFGWEGGVLGAEMLGGRAGSFMQ